jgi:hypothetical protein
MADQIIKISQLNPLGTLSQYDFFPVDQSSSLTTYRTDINTLNTWFSVSGSASYSTTASYVENAVSASYVPDLYHQSYQSSCSWASASISSSYSLTSSAANSITFIPNLSNTASYITSSNLVGIVNSSSYSTSASYALTASYVAPAAQNNGPKFITPINMIPSGGPEGAYILAGDWQQYNCPTEYIPIGTSTIILDGNLNQNSNAYPAYFDVSAISGSFSPMYTLLELDSAYVNIADMEIGGQGTFPCSSSLSTSSSIFWRCRNRKSVGTNDLRLIGYY